MLSLSPHPYTALSRPQGPPEAAATPVLVPAAQSRLSLSISCSAAQRGGRRGKSDDYHATIKSLNSKGRHKPRKSLGQHYMLNSSVNEEMVAIAEVGEGDLVLEIGPGTGSLTNVLLDAGATVLAIEKDPHMAMLVKDRFTTQRLMVLQEDFMKCHFHEHLSTLREKSSLEIRSYAKVVSNLPFNISADVIKLLLPMGDIFSDIVLLLQDETAMRLTDYSLRTSEYRQINIFVNFYSDPEYKLRVERINFFPQPNVDAAVIRFKLKRSADYPPVVSCKSFFSMVNSAFNGKRKMLRKSLQYLCPPIDIEAALNSMGLPVTARPEELTMDDFVRLHNLIARVASVK